MLWKANKILLHSLIVRLKLIQLAVTYSVGAYVVSPRRTMVPDICEVHGS